MGNRAASWVIKGAIGLAALGCASKPQAVMVPELLPAACTALAGLTIPASEIGVPGGAAQVQDSTPRSAAEASNRNGQFCQVRGTIAPLDPKAPVIRFAVNLPARWNGKLLQYGGGGFNGSVVTGLGKLDHAPNERPTPLALGYVTMGDDSGHSGGGTDASFALNDEALANYSRYSRKKTQDVARALMRRMYQVARPDKSYFIGSSTGGRDALNAVQHWPEDYDGIFIHRPALNYTGMRLANIRLGQSVFLNKGQGWLNPGKTRLLLDTVMASCDTLDALQDGIISAWDPLESTCRHASLSIL